MFYFMARVNTSNIFRKNKEKQHGIYHETRRKKR